MHQSHHFLLMDYQCTEKNVNYFLSFHLLIAQCSIFHFVLCCIEWNRNLKSRVMKIYANNFLNYFTITEFVR